jgi:hypothetical protein
MTPAQPVRGSNFSYLLPHGWRVGEEGPFALVLLGADAGIVVFGQSGLMEPLAPEQFAYQAMAGVMRLAPDVRLTNPRPCQPRPGYTHAAVMDCTYTLSLPAGPVRMRGVVVSHVAVGYGHCSGTLTLAAADERQWPQYQNWLPQVASAAVNTGPNAYGNRTMAGVMGGIAEQDHDAYRRYQEHSTRTWQGVVDARTASADWRQGQMGQVLTGQEWHADPYGGPAVRRSTTPAVIWRSYDGREVASDDPSFDPRTASDCDWRRVR